MEEGLKGRNYSLAKCNDSSRKSVTSRKAT